MSAGYKVRLRWGGGGEGEVRRGGEERRRRGSVLVIENQILKNELVSISAVVRIRIEERGRSVACDWFK